MNRKMISVVLTFALILQLMAAVFMQNQAAHAAASGPVLYGTYPQDNATGIPPSANFVMTFDENVAKGGGSTAITIKRVSDNTVVESIPLATTDNRVQIGSTNRNVVTINPNTVLANDTEYYIVVDQGAFVNMSNGAAFAGITSATAWNFRTGNAVPDNTPPVLDTQALLPAHQGQASWETTLTLPFSKIVYASSGAVTIRNQSTGEVQAIPVVSEHVTGSGTNTIVVRPADTLLPDTTYQVTMNAGAFQDAAGNNTAAIAAGSWIFTTQPSPLAITSLSPANGAVNVAADAPLKLDFAAEISKGTGNIRIIRLSNNSVTTVSASSSSVSVSGRSATITVPGSLSLNTDYYVLVDAGAFVANNDSTVRFPGITSASVWNFKTIDNVAPTIATYKPARSATVNELAVKLELAFSEPVYPGSGAITIRNAATNAIFTTIPVTSSQVVGGGSANIVVTAPNLTYTNNTSYYVEIGNQAFRDASGNTFTGISSSSGWPFRVSLDSVGPTLSQLAPANNSQHVTLNETFYATFSKPIALQSTTETQFNLVQTNTGFKVALNASIDPLHSARLVLQAPVGSLASGNAYYIEIGEGAVTDLSGNAFTGILNEYQWTFRTIGSDTTPPALSKAEMNGTANIVLTYNEPIDPSSVPSPGNFYVTVNDTFRNVSKVAVTGSTVVVTLQSGIIYGQVVKISYSKGTQPIRDLSGNAAASFAGREVASSSTSTTVRPTSGNVAGNTVTLVFNDSLAALHANAYSQFTVNVGGSIYPVTSAFSNGPVLFLTLSTPVTVGQSVAVSYTANYYPLISQSGSAVPAFSSFYVANQLDTTPPVLQSIYTSGDTIILVYNEGLNPIQVPDKARYSVLVGGAARNINTITIANNQVIITVAGGTISGAAFVSYVAGTPALADLSGNAAVSFSNVQANAGGGGNNGGNPPVGTVQLIAADVRTTLLTLTFNQAINTAYVPATTQFTVKVNGVARTVQRITPLGQTVSLVLQSAVGIGDTVLVSYSPSPIAMQSTTGVQVAGFYDYRATNQASWIDALPADYEAGLHGGIAIRLSGSVRSSAVTASNLSTGLYTIAPDKLMAAYNLLRTWSPSTPHVSFVVPAVERAALVSIPLQQLEEAKKLMSAATFTIQFGNAAYEVPLASLDFEKLAAAAGGRVATTSLLLELDPNATSLTSPLTTIITRNKAEAVEPAANFEAWVTSGASKVAVKTFAGYVKRSFTTSNALDTAKAAVVWLDPETGILSYVPTVFSKEGAETTATFLRKTNSAYALVTNTQAYNDIARHWANSEVSLLSNKFIVEGRTSTGFQPDERVTRAEFAMFIARGLGLPGNKEAAAKFTDIDTSKPAAAYIGAAANAGIVLGNTNGTFAPDKLITRQEMAAMIIRAAGAADVKVVLSQSASTYLQKYKDRAKISAWALQDVARAIEAGVMNGLSTDTFSPLTNASRAQAAVMVKRLLDYIDFL